MNIILKLGSKGSAYIQLVSHSSRQRNAELWPSEQLLY
jgi:hypothetical protein